MIGVMIYSTRHESRVMTEEIKKRGETICRLIADLARDPLVNKDVLSLWAQATRAYRNPGVLYAVIIDEENKIYGVEPREDTTIFKFRSESEFPITGKDTLPLIAQSDTLLFQEFEYKGKQIYNIGAPVKLKGLKIGMVHIGLSKEAIIKAIQEARRGMLIGALIAVAVGVVIIYVLVSLIVGSLGKITEDIVAIGEGHLDRYKTMVVKRTDEIGDIARSVKEMAMKLERAQQELIEKERMRKEMAIAREIQQALLPKSLPKIKGFDVSAFYQPAREVGGDYYDIISIDDKHYGFVVADVSGKSVSGALIMAMMRMVLRVRATSTLSAKEAIAMTNDELAPEIPEDMFITTLYTIVDTESGVFKLCNAGHNEGLLISNGTLTPLKPAGMPIGIGLVDTKGFREHLEELEQKFNPGDTLVLFTDGVTEAMNSVHEEYGEERFFTILKNHADELDAKALTEKVINDIKDFTGGIEQSDDITLVIIKKL